jgi:bleomycin hydrolase
MKSKLFTFFLLAFLFSGFIQAQEKGYVFTKVTEVTATSVKNQFKSGTCWSFSGLALLEAEILRTKKIEVDLSDMWVVRHAYYEKAIRYIRFHGTNNFGGGGAFHDVTNMIRKYGIVPEGVYNGLNYGTEGHVHGELDDVLKAYVDAVLKNSNKELSTAWLAGFNGILDAYFGPVPEKFTWEGKEYTPQSYAASLGIVPDDYIVLTSFTHAPFYKPFVLELPDNWAHDVAYNVPLAELEEVIDYALKNGFTVAWASDVSEKGFSWRSGVAIVPEVKLEDMAGTERERWEKLSPSEREKEIYKFEKPISEMQITQENRQKAFDNHTTTDDHGMLLTGIYNDQNGTKYYKVKNSWDVTNVYEGYFYASRAFVLFKTTDIMIHKDALPKTIAKKLGF